MAYQQQPISNSNDALPPGWDYDHREDMAGYGGNGNYNDNYNQQEYEREGQGANEGEGLGAFQDPHPPAEQYQADQPNIPLVQMPRIPRVKVAQIRPQWLQPDLSRGLMNDSPSPSNSIARTQRYNQNLQTNSRSLSKVFRQAGVPVRNGQVNRFIRQLRRY